MTRSGGVTYWSQGHIQYLSPSSMGARVGAFVVLFVEWMDALVHISLLVKKKRIFETFLLLKKKF